MSQTPLNALCTSLRDACAADPLRPKWLVVPSRRVGYQWLDAVARAGQPVLMVRQVTLRGIALELAGPRLARRGRAPLGGADRLVLIDRVVGRLRAEGAGYLSDLRPTPGLLDAVGRSLRDLRLAGLTAAQLTERPFEVPSKGRDVRTLLRLYEEALEAAGAVDHADVLRLAVERLGQDPEAVDPAVWILLPREGEPAALERRLLSALPREQVRSLPVDGPGDGGPAATDADHLAWIQTPADAPPPVGDGSVELVRAVGEAAEVREVLRRCAAGGIPLDHVEVLHTDAGTYGPLFYELAATVGGGERLPVTFAEGIPTRYTRPGRALQAWLEWVRGDHPQAVLVRMIQDGLVRVPEQAGLGLARLGALLRSVPIGAGRERYLPALDAALRGAEHQHAGLARADAAVGTDAARAAVEAKRAGLALLRALVQELLARTPARDAGQGAVLAGAEAFLTGLARAATELDQYAAVRLLDEIRGLAAALPEGDALAGLDVWEWLAALPAGLRVAGQGPRPGCLYVAPLLQGGHSGRPHTFVVGLDDARFPGGGAQDPVLLDGEREALHAELSTAAHRQARQEEDLARALARLRGHVTLSYSCRDLADDRERVPSPVLLSAFRIVSGRRQADLEALLDAMPPPASRAPEDAARCVDATEWWLWRACGAAPVEDPEAAIAAHFPHLARGFRARDARASDRFTEYDGHVPAAGPAADPTRPDGPVVSASRLELLGRCPLDYFFRYVLGIAPPEEMGVDPEVWLDAATRGGLLHEVFQRFVAQLVARGERPDAARDEAALMAILAERVEHVSRELPPPNEDLRRRVVAELEQTARIFLQEEQEHCRDREPVGLEAAIGMQRVEGGTFLDSPEPVAVWLPDGTALRARGQIDRVDRLPGRGDEYELWDYKTGSTYGYDPADPFRGGRRVQSVLYRAMADARLHEVVGPRARVVRFGYFFPSARTHGERISWTAEQLSGGERVLGRLVALLRRGCFPTAEDGGDLTFSDYAAAHGDHQRAADDLARKLAADPGEALDPLRALREGGGDGD